MFGFDLEVIFVFFKTVVGCGMSVAPEAIWGTVCWS